jgi:predicted HTH domain antitoxin
MDPVAPEEELLPEWREVGLPPEPAKEEGFWGKAWTGVVGFFSSIGSSLSGGAVSYEKLGVEYGKTWSIQVKAEDTWRLDVAVDFFLEDGYTLKEAVKYAYLSRYVPGHSEETLERMVLDAALERQLRR